MILHIPAGRLNSTTATLPSTNPFKVFYEQDISFSWCVHDTRTRIAIQKKREGGGVREEKEGRNGKKED